MAKKPRRSSRKKVNEGLEEDEHDWEWEWADGIPDVDFDPRRSQKIPPPTDHTSVKRPGCEPFKIGDLAQFNGADSRRWVGMIRGFETWYSRKEGIVWKVYAQWFNTQHDLGKKMRIKGTPDVRFPSSNG